jgi:hypothetical protein
MKCNLEFLHCSVRFKSIFLCLITIFVFHISFAQNGWLWGVSGKGNAFLPTVATDNKGNCLAAGILIFDTVHFGAYNLIDTGKDYDFYLLKLDPNGNILWAKQTINLTSSGPIDNDIGVSTDGSGNSYLMANFQDSMIVGTDSLINAIGFLNNFIAKYDGNGNVIWCRKSICINDSGMVVGKNNSSDTHGNIFVTGSFIDTVQFGLQTIIAPYSATLLLTFIVKYDLNGSVKWARQSVGKNKYSGATAWGVANDKYGNSFETGYFVDTIIFGSDTLNALPNEIKAFITKYDSNGNVVWAEQSENSILSNATGWRLVVDLSGNVYVEGVFTDSIVFGKDTLIASTSQRYQESIFLVKYAPNGNVIWAKQVEALDNNSWYPDAISIDKYNQIYLYGDGGGGTSGTFTIKFGDSTLQAVDTSVYDHALLILKLDSNGNIICSDFFAGGYSGGSGGIASDSSGNNVYLCDFATTTMVFGSDTVNPFSTPPSSFWQPSSMPYIARWEECDRVLGVNNIKANYSNLMVYPNPSKGTFNFVLSNVNDKCNVEIYNVLGEKIYTETLQTQDNNTINISGQPNGVYLYRVISEDGKFIGSGKVVIEK